MQIELLHNHTKLFYRVFESCFEVFFMENGLLLSKWIECEVLGTLILCIENDLGLKKMLKMWTLEIL